jgi:hypothetical protein
MTGSSFASRRERNMGKKYERPADIKVKIAKIGNEIAKTATKLPSA